MPYHFAHDLNRRFLDIEIRGFWTTHDMASFQKEAGDVLRRAILAGAKPGEGKILVDASNFPIQDKAITDEISQLIPIYGKLARRIAIVGSDSALQRMQAKRLVGDNAAVFASKEDATAWLFASDS